MVSHEHRGAAPAATLNTVMALPGLMDPMYWLGEGGLFASAVLPGILVIVFIETGLLFPILPVVLVVLAFNFMGDGLRDALDPYH